MHLFFHITIAFFSYLRNHQHDSPLGKYEVQVSESINVVSTANEMFP